MTLSKTFILISLSFSSQLLHAHSNSDSLYIHYKDSQLLNRTARPTLQVNARESFRKEFSYMGIPFIASGLIVKKRNSDFRTLRNRFQPAFHLRYDDYTQYVPLAATWGLKLAGLEGRSSWKELNDMQTRTREFQERAQQDYQKKQNELLAPIIDKAKSAIDKVAAAGGFLVVFDTSTGSLAYFDEATLTDVAPAVKKELGITDAPAAAPAAK